MQFRIHQKFTILHRLRLIYYKIKLGYCGNKVLFYNNVKIFRFPKNVSIDDNVAVKEGVRICACNKNARISIGENTTIGYHTFIFSSKSISIGKDCLIAPFVYIVDSNHGIDKSMKINMQQNTSKEITIGNDVWVGSNVTILGGVKIGDGAVIGANSLVNKDIEPYTIVAGNPIRFIKNRE